MSSRLRELTATTPEMAALFDDAATLAAALRFEAALAAASADEGLIPRVAAKAIDVACREPLDAETLAHEAAHAGTLAIPLVAAVRGRLDAETAAHLHRGATSQDLADTVMMLQAQGGWRLLAEEVDGLLQALATLAEAHAETPALGRTLLQPARPITFGLKAANWLLLTAGAAQRLRREAESAIRLQFGGAAGARHDLGGRGEAVARRLAAALGLPDALPWHARREAVAGLAAALAILVGAVGKIARDVSLLAQAEVGEAFEPRIEGRGGSSAMPGKRNPTGCQVALGASLRAPPLAAGVMAGLPQEHERGLGGWQAEAPAMAELFQLAHGAVRNMREVIEGLEVAPVAMRARLPEGGAADTGEASRIVRAALTSWREGR